MLAALGDAHAEADEFRKVEELHRLTGCEVPAPLAQLKDKTVRFSEVCDHDADSMKAVVYRLLNITE